MCIYINIIYIYIVNQILSKSNSVLRNALKRAYFSFK